LCKSTQITKEKLHIRNCCLHSIFCTRRVKTKQATQYIGELDEQLTDPKNASQNDLPSLKEFQAWVGLIVNEIRKCLRNFNTTAFDKHSLLLAQHFVA